jgi:CheY-like chemotaxis protein
VTAHGVVLSDDLIFFSRITEAARACGLAVTRGRTPAEFLALVGQHTPGGVILDLHNPDLDLANLLTELRAACPTMPPVIAYGSHVQAEVLRQAREAGCDRVMPRSQFVAELDASIAGWLAH